MATSSSSTSSSIAQPRNHVPAKPTLPKRLPPNADNMEQFETGFDETLVKGGLEESVWMCSICRGLPRHPATIDGCGHLFCEGCIRQHYMMTKRPDPSFLTIEDASCPNCKQKFHYGDLKTWDLVDAWSKMVYQTKEVSCPFKCGFVGSPFDADDHQFYTCPLRPIKCPNNGCSLVDKASHLESEHYPHCPFLRMYCSNCRLPVQRSQRGKHNCIGALQGALQGRLNV